jgi:tetratricopeptide (TPR) repeat protein
MWQTIRYEKVRTAPQPDASASSDGEGNTPDAESAEDTSETPDAPTALSSNVFSKGRTRTHAFTQLARSSAYPFLLNRMLRQAREFENRGMLDQAALEYRLILIKFPSDRISQYRLERIQATLSKQRRDVMSRASREAGLNEFRFGNYRKAAPHLVAAVEAGRVDIPTLYALGMTQVQLGHYADAQTVLNRCLAASPNYAPALVGLAQAHIALGEKNRALPLLNRALELGGGAEFTPVKIEEMISSIVISKAARKP